MIIIAYFLTENEQQTTDIERFRPIRILLNRFVENLMKQLNGFFTELRCVEMKIYFDDGHVGIQFLFECFCKYAVSIGIIKRPSFPVKGAPAL